MYINIFIYIYIYIYRAGPSAFYIGRLKTIMWCDDFWAVLQSGDCFSTYVHSKTITWWEKWLTTITSHDSFNFPIYVMFVRTEWPADRSTHGVTRGHENNENRHGYKSAVSSGCVSILDFPQPAELSLAQDKGGPSKGGFLNSLLFSYTDLYLCNELNGMCI